MDNGYQMLRELHLLDIEADHRVLLDVRIDKAEQIIGLVVSSFMGREAVHCRRSVRLFILTFGALPAIPLPPSPPCGRFVQKINFNPLFQISRSAA